MEKAGGGENVTVREDSANPSSFITKTMRTRDLGILIISLIAIIISINQEGSISIVHSWYMEIDPTGSTYRNGNAPDPSEKL